MKEVDNRRIAIYKRVSTKQQYDEGCSLEVQDNQCHKFIYNMGYSKDIIDVYADGGKSGTNIDNRDELQKLLVNIKHGVYKMVVMMKFDRLTRDLVDFNDIIKLCNNNNCSLISLDNPKADLKNPTEKANANVAMIFSQLQPELTSQRVKDVIRDKLENGLYPFGGKTPLGYKRKLSDDLLTPTNELVLSDNPEEVSIVKRIFTEMASGKSALQLANELTIEQSLGRSWVDKSIIKMIKNKIYIGIVEWNGITYKNIVKDLIIDKELFDKANYYVSRSAKIKKYDYAYSNLCKCNECGTYLQQKSTNKKGVIYYYYYCPNCKKRINEKVLDRQLSIVTNSLYNQEILNIEKSDEEKNIEKKVKHLKKAISNYYEISVTDGSKEQLIEYHDFKKRTDVKIKYYNQRLKKIQQLKRKSKKYTLSNINNSLKCQLFQKYIKYIDVNLTTKEVRNVIRN